LVVFGCLPTVLGFACVVCLLGALLSDLIAYSVWVRLVWFPAALGFA
jgi:hypothetical protein